MQLLQLTSLALSLALTVLASTAAPGIHLTGTMVKAVSNAKAMGFSILPFQIANVTTALITAVNTTIKIPHYHHPKIVTTPANATISFNFTDPNSNTSISTCTNSWIQNSTVVPTSYVLCPLVSGTSVTEYFSWKFTSYSGADAFQMMFAHIFYSPSFGGYVEYFSAATNFSLSCLNATGSRCTLSDALSPVAAPINAISG